MKSFVLSTILAIVLAGGIAWWFDLLPDGTVPTSISGGGPPPPPQPGEFGQLLYGKEEENGDAKEETLPPQDDKAEPTVVTATLTSKELRVPALADGEILFIGEEIEASGTELPPQESELKKEVFLAGGKRYQVVYRPWTESQIVKYDQMLAMLNPAMAIQQMGAAEQAHEIAKREIEVSKLRANETEQQYKRAEKAFTDGGLSNEEFGIKRTQYMMSREEVKKSKVAAKKTEMEYEMASMMYHKHRIQDKLPGYAVIHSILKRPGESVKKGETIMILRRVDDLKAEGRMRSQDYSYWKRKQQEGRSKVTIQPIFELKPYKVFRKGHHHEITSVAVHHNLKDGKPTVPTIVSGGKDKMVCFWWLTQQVPIHRAEHDSEVLVVACAPGDSKTWWCLSGCADGSIYRWDLANLKESKKQIREPDATQTSITALAFSPDGKYFASGDESGNIIVWETETGKELYPVDTKHGAEDVHAGGITSLYFTPQCYLVSASRDKTLRVYRLYQRGVSEEKAITVGRTGNVADLGVTADGEYLLLDRGKSLEFLSIPKGDPVMGLRNLSPGCTFETVATFNNDPMVKMMLSAGAPEGRLQLWRSPSDNSRGHELCQFVPREGSRVTCAAFAPHTAKIPALEKVGGGSFAVSGAENNYLYVWALPDQGAVLNHCMVGLPWQSSGIMEAGGEYQIFSHVNATTGDKAAASRLRPGMRVNIVIEEK
ncbi:MAG: hypothetical protein ACFCD0_17500 [Gemmataceae bacterium]